MKFNEVQQITDECRMVCGMVCMKILIAILTLTLVSVSVNADEVQILDAEFKTSGDNQWSVDVTLKHKDTGWSHYADNWRIIDPDGNILGDRILYHPHVNEQPFTRSLSHIKIPNGSRIVFIEAHDKKHGWSKNRLKINLNKAEKGYLKVKVN